MSELKRRGNVAKCPICGSQVDPEAYHCPACHNYYCYHCRARLLASDTQLQCANQSCDYYGKLVCSVCDPQGEKEEPPAVYEEPEDGYWPLWLIVSLIIGGLVWYFAGFLWGAGTAIVLYGLGGYLMQRFGLNIFGKVHEVTHKRVSSFHTCICCGQTVKEMEHAV